MALIGKVTLLISMIYPVISYMISQKSYVFDYDIRYFMIFMLFDIILFMIF